MKGDPPRLEELHGRLDILDLSIAEHSCSIMLLETRLDREPRSRAVWACFQSMGLCASYLPECLSAPELGEEDSEALWRRRSVTVFTESRWLRHLRESTDAEFFQPALKHWRILASDGTLNVATNVHPDVSLVALGSRFEREPIEVPAG